MAVPDTQFQTIIDNIEQIVKDTIAAEIGKASPKPLSPLFDLDEFREQLLEAVRSELRLFKEELVIELQEKLHAAPTDPLQPVKKSSWLDKKIF